jgi:hypothetical protein
MRKLIRELLNKNNGENNMRAALDNSIVIEFIYGGEVCQSTRACSDKEVWDKLHEDSHYLRHIYEDYAKIGAEVISIKRFESSEIALQEQRHNQPIIIKQQEAKKWTYIAFTFIGLNIVLTALHLCKVFE